MNGGYHPDTVEVELGQPAQITFRREDDAACSEQVVFADFGVTTSLALNEDVTVELHPEQPGDYAFTCGMGMLRGTLTVRPAEGGTPPDERHQPRASSPASSSWLSS